MRVLTSITIVITIPVLVSSFFGMNVRLPGQEHPYAFGVIIGVSLVLSLGAVAYFRRKRWLDP